ncbi:MAG: saccharopine dehydrogenase C-terminal domain-containing protein [Gemmatimonadota bacterium]
MTRIAVLGAGRVGGAIARDLAATFEVTSVDRDAGRLDAMRREPGLGVLEADLSDGAAVTRLAEDHDLVVSAVPGFLGLETLKAVIASGRDVVDISFFDGDPFALDDLARARGVTAVVDCGVAPGLSHILLGHHARAWEVEDFECLVGGLPAKPEPPWLYRAPFSPLDVLEEYTRPARLVEGGRPVTKPALSDPELVRIEPVGELEAFLTDGLRTALRTMAVPGMREKTLRYPGHLAAIRALRDGGFLSREPVEVSGASVRPIDVAAALLLPAWRPEPGEEDLTVMRIRIRGREGPTAREVEWRLVDRTDPITGTSSMARTTGYTCTAVARLLLSGRVPGPGIVAPETVGAAEGNLDRILDDLAARGVQLEREDGRISPA